jgi:uncharacterized protein (TIGR00369 family)
MPQNVLTAAELEARLRQAPFNAWMELHVAALTEEFVDIALSWKPEMANARLDVAHGGVLSALIDAAADYAIAAKLGRAVPTVDLRVDFHQPAKRGDLRARARIVRLGGTLAVAEAEAFDADDRLVASGRGTYFTAAPEAKS